MHVRYSTATVKRRGASVKLEKIGLSSGPRQSVHGRKGHCECGYEAQSRGRAPGQPSCEHGRGKIGDDDGALQDEALFKTRAFARRLAAFAGAERGEDADEVGPGSGDVGGD